jgi:hypothetical protein
MAPFVEVPDPMNRHHLADPDLLYVSTKCKSILNYFFSRKFKYTFNDDEKDTTM